MTAAINCYRGMKCWSKDIKRSALEDITLPQEEKMICDAIDSKFLDYIHFAPPCHMFFICTLAEAEDCNQADSNVKCCRVGVS